MRIVDKSLKWKGITDDDRLYVPIRKHRELIKLYFKLMYTKYQQDLCPGGKLCLEGVYTVDDDDYLISTPYPCPLGSYCLIGSDSVIGTGLCPIGYFCKERTEYPEEAKAGTYTGGQGSVEPQQC
jgi:hypothetical protein